MGTSSSGGDSFVSASGPACTGNPLATGAPLTTTTGSAVYTYGGINLGTQYLPLSATDCEAPVIGNTCPTSALAGVANNNSLLQAAATQSKLVEYAAIALLAVGLFFLWKHLSK